MSDNWTWNNNYRDLTQVERFYPAYLARFEQLQAAGKYPYNASFRGHVSGIEGPDEDRAIYMLQTLRGVREVESTVAIHRAAGWRDMDPAELHSGPVRFAGVAEYGFYMGGTGFREWSNARLTMFHSSMMLLPGRNRTNGQLVTSKVIVKDR